MNSETADSSKNATALVSIPESKHRPSRTWSECMKKILEIDPLRCPTCSGAMRIVAFILDPNEISRLMKNLNIPQPIMPNKPARSPPESNDQFMDDLPDYEGLLVDEWPGEDQVTK